MKVFNVIYDMGNYGKKNVIVAAENETAAILLVRNENRYQYLSDPIDFWRFPSLDMFSATEIPGIYSKKEGVKTTIR